MKKVMKEGSYLGNEYQIIGDSEDGDPVIVVVDRFGSELIRQDVNFREGDNVVDPESEEAEDFWHTAVEIAENSTRELIKSYQAQSDEKLNPFE